MLDIGLLLDTPVKKTITNSAKQGINSNIKIVSHGRYQKYCLKIRVGGVSVFSGLESSSGSFSDNLNRIMREFLNTIKQIQHELQGNLQQTVENYPYSS